MEYTPVRVAPTPITDKEAQAKANIEATNEAHRLAAEHRARDAQNEPPLINVLSESIKEKLQTLPPEEPEQQNQ